ncbi:MULTISPECIES: hypothetical protein [Acinetobacter]|uniref:hypothetical protein n=1 Tax=Acinetobacter TaxID=469 RepID=UPI000A699825|nr:hypothetical protein [Acinetobacter sp. BMW17]
MTKFKIVTNRIYRIEREMEFNSHDEAVAYAEELQRAELPDDAVRSDDLGVQEIS